MGTIAKRNIFLCGFMATGKSSVGMRLAAKIDFEFIDMDAVIETQSGMTIPQIFASQGESAFRALESRLIERLSKKIGCVVATGGGAIVNPQNLEIMKRSGIVVTLTADTETILQRCGSGEDRPMLQGGDRLVRIRTLLEQRAPAYAQADIVLDTSSRTIDEVAQDIADYLQKSGCRERLE
jgi:shikimate kinase